MKNVKTLVSMLLKDRLDLSFLSTKGSTIRKVVFFILRFGITFGVAYGLFYVSSMFKIFHNSLTLPTSLMTLVVSILMVFTTISVTNELMKTLFLAKDNQLLITLPVKPNDIFLSKIIVFYIFEVIRNATFTLPIFIAFGFMSNVSWFFFIWILVALLFLSMVPVVLGIALSLPTLVINRFFAKFRLTKHLVYISFLGLLVYILVRVILIIPSSLNIIHYWQPIKDLLSSITTFFYDKFRVVHYLVVMSLGKYQNSRYTFLHYEPWVIFGIALAIMAAILASTYFIVRNVFLRLISYDYTKIKPISLETKRQKRLPKFLTFIKKEILLLGRNGEFSYNYAMTYVGVPLIILLVNKLFSSMELYADGRFFVQALNVLLIMLPFLASNSVIAKSFSEEGRTGYMKRTKPINVIVALTAKLIPNIILSSISIIVTMYIFNVFMNYLLVNIVLLTASLIIIQVGHIFISALLDIMKPQNEQYATTGEQFSNPNESKSTIVAFIIAFITAGIVLVFLNERQVLPEARYNSAFLKMFWVSVVYLGAIIYLFIWSIRAFYYDRGEAQ